MKSNVTPRAAALDGCLSVAKGQTLDAWLPTLYGSDLSVSDKGFARQLLMSTLRHHGQLAATLTAYIDKPLEGKLQPVDWVLRLGVAQLLLLNTPAHAAIDESVRLCKQRGFVHQAGLVNAVLRKVSAERPDLPPATYNLPSWLKGAWRKTYGRDACDAIAEQARMEPLLDVSLVEGYVLEGEALLSGSIRLSNQDMTALPGYGEARLWAQDVAATLPVRALGEVAGKHVLDLCAAPGGKTLQLLAAGAQVSAVDRSGVRLQRVHENLNRMQMQAEIIEADLLQWQPDAAPDAVLLDAPCSATGTLRRHPDLLLNKREKDVAEMVALQRVILTQVMHWLPVGVPLVYAVCSLQPEEGEQQIEWLLNEYTDLSLEPFAIEGIPRQWHPVPGQLRTLPHYWSDKGGMDGFFIAKLRLR